MRHLAAKVIVLAVHGLEKHLLERDFQARSHAGIEADKLCTGGDGHRKPDFFLLPFRAAVSLDFQVQKAEVETRLNAQETGEQQGREKQQ